MTETQDKPKGITVQALYDHIVSQITPEAALKKLLESSLIEYEKLKFDKETGKSVHPVIIISMATMDLGWHFIVEKDRENIEGLIIGTEEYMKRMMPPKSEPTIPQQ